MRLTEIHVGRYGPIGRRTVELGRGVHVLYGPNEAGKTLFLDATLRLIEPDITGAMPGLRRIDEEPHGYVRLSTGDGETQLDGSESLFAGTDVDPEHLANIFVVRESALSLLAEEHSFYTSLTEHIGELHTSALDLIEDELLERGRLTRSRRQLSSAEGRDEAERVRDRAEALREEIVTYVEEAESRGLDGLEGRLVATRARLDALEDEVEALDRAEALHRHRRLEGRLDAFRATSEELEELSDLSRDVLRDLHRRRDAVRAESGRIASWEDEVGEHEERAAQLRERVEEKADELAPLEERERDVERVADRLREFQETTDPGSGLEDAERAALRTGVGLAGGGVLLQALSLGLGLGLDAVALAAAALGAAGLAGYGVLRRLRRREEAERRALARDAADAGLEAEEPREIAAAIRTFRSRRQGIGERIEELEAEADDHRTRVDTLTDQIEKSRGEIEEHEARIEEVLDDAGVGSVDDYEARLERKEELELERSAARQSLSESLREPDADDWREAVEAWREELEAIVDGVAREEAADDYDPAAHREKSETLEELEREARELADRLDEHRDRIDRFDRRLRDEVDAEPFLGARVELEARTTEGLRRLARELGELVRRIERDAEVSRVVLEVVDDLRAAEERKITDLFASDGPATDVFRRISDERYRSVRYDPDARSLLVSGPDGRELTPEQLSKGARDQMYLSARVGLASRLLGGDRGFFVLDDPLVAADRERLTAAFRVLRSLAEEGWQILYFTAKEEVRDAMVEEFSLGLTTFGDRL